MDTGKILQNTLGDLIVALTEETTRLVRDKKEAYNLVAFMLVNLLSNSGATSRPWQYWH